MAAPFVELCILSRWLPCTLRRRLGEDAVAMPPARILMICSLICLLNFSILGGIVDILALGVGGTQESYFVTATGLFALAWVHGFIVPGAPG